MSNKINIAAAAALLTAVAASELSSGEFASLQGEPGTSRATAFDSVAVLTRRCGPRTTMPPSDRTTTDPTGDVIATSANRHVCL